MAHGTNIISHIQLPGRTTKYEIHDAQAIHSISDLDLTKVMRFVGSKADEATIFALTGMEAGEVWHAQAEGTEWLWDGSAWIELGNPLVDNHIHAITAEGTNASSSVSGTASGSITPELTQTAIYTKASTSAVELGTTPGTFVTGLGTPTTEKAITALNTGSVATVGSAEDVSVPVVSSNGTVTASKVTTEDVSIPNVTGNTTVTASKIASSNVSIPNVTGNTTVTASKVTTASKTASKLTSGGTQASWTATVSGSTLVFGWTPNEIATASNVTFNAVSANDEVVATNTTLGTALSASKITSNTDVTATNTTLGTALSASKVSASDVTATKTVFGTAATASHVVPGSATVVTGSKTSVDFVKGYTPTTGSALTAVNVSSQPVTTLSVSGTSSTGAVKTGNSVSGKATTASLTVTGTAAAQKWTGTAVETGTPIGVNQ